MVPLSEYSDSAEDIDENSPIEFEVKHLGQYEAEGILLLYPDRVVFSPKEDYDVKIEIPVAKIVDARFATEKDISALRVWLVGPVLGTLWKKQHKMLTIDVEDEFGIIQHLVFEGEGVQEIVDELYEIRKKRRMRPLSPKAESEPSLKITAKSEQTLLGNWKCAQCLRINSRKVRFCTRCGSERE
jgi:hypothetical protein